MMTTKSVQIIETKRLIIKPLSQDELNKHILDPDELARNMGVKPSMSLGAKETTEAIKNDLLPRICLPDKDPLFYTMWIIIEKNIMAIIGGICFHGEPDQNGEVEIGYGIDNEHQNKGYMTEAIEGLTRWAVGKKRIRIIRAETSAANISSLRVLEKNDFEITQQTIESVIMKKEILH